jgi:hypothetical protein
VIDVRVAVDATPLLDVPTGVSVFTREVLERLGRRDDLVPQQPTFASPIHRLGGRGRAR